jgi:hypothetical protein
MPKFHLALAEIICLRPSATCIRDFTRGSYNHSILAEGEDRAGRVAHRESNRGQRRFNSRNCTLNLRYTPNRVTPANSDRSQHLLAGETRLFRPKELLWDYFRTAFVRSCACRWQQQFMRSL